MPVLVPSDCVDGFGAAFWFRPESYLEPEVQAGTSWIALLTDQERAPATQRLRIDHRVHGIAASGICGR